MSRPVSYNTRQREAVLSYIASVKDSHVTAAEIVGHFKNTADAIGRTTVYRLLDKLTENGEIRRYTTDGVSGACYQFTNRREDCHSHLHLKCENCGELTHLECGALAGLEEHMLSEHAFKLNPMKTVLYGQCDNCAKNNSRVN
jgi:Fur family ferric uptake transcriptional regulator